MDYLAEAAKIFVPAGLSSALVAYYFQRKLKRLGSYEEATKVLLQRTLDSTERVYGAAQSLDLTLDKLDKAISDPQPNRDHVMAALLESMTAGDAVLKEIRSARIYATVLIPFGGSGGYSSGLQTLTDAWDILESHPNEIGNPKLISAVKRSIEHLNKKHLDLRGAVETLKFNILSGDRIRPPKSSN